MATEPTNNTVLSDTTGYPFALPNHHSVNGAPSCPPWPSDVTQAWFGMGCFWGAERLFWQTPGVFSTAVGYAGGHTTYPTYHQVCAGTTGHAEVVLVAYRPSQITFSQLVARFFEHHDPTQVNRQGPDVGSQYRSMIFTNTPAEYDQAYLLRNNYQPVLDAAGYGPIATDIVRQEDHAFYYAEPEHQQYLHKVPHGYCSLGPNGHSCPTGIPAS